jgi:hypothetical protein
MVKERRAFSRLPCYLQTDQNNRDAYISDDVMFEPERAGFLSGYIGDVSLLTQEDLERQPQIIESTPLRQKHQLSLAAVLVDPTTSNRSSGSFYTDLIGQIAANGGIIDDENTLFENPFYAWSPPFDYDKNTNYTRYYWTGAGNAQVNGEYITREPQGSATVMYELTTTGFVPRPVILSGTAPVSPAVGQLWEDTSTVGRIVYQWTGTIWLGLDYTVESTIPASTDYTLGDFVYVTRTGPAFNRPLIWKYSIDAGRWISHPVVVGPIPDSPTEGMIWEDARLVPNRNLMIFRNGAFVPLIWTTTTGPTGPTGNPAITTYQYDLRTIDSNDGWSANNWWRHYDDLSPADRAALLPGDQAVRPIIEFWAGIELAPGSTRIARHTLPRFTIYKSSALGAVAATTNSSTIFQYQVGVGQDDSVMEFPLVFNQTGEFQFELTLETDSFSDIIGYRYFRDTFTGLTHSIWSKSDTVTSQDVDSTGVIDIPKNLTANADHDVLKVASRSQMLGHISSIIQSQDNFQGNRYGLNNYRWTNKSPTAGATIIDCENSLLRVMGTLQRPELDIPDSIRRIARDYNRIVFKFSTRMSQLWDDLTISEPGGTLIVSVSSAVDLILTELFIGRTDEFPYFNSDMGTYVETQSIAGSITVIGTTPRPIFIPPSPPRIGASPVYRPEKFTDRDGRLRLRGHEGMIIPSFGDQRDDLWLEFQTRLFNAVPGYYRDETAVFSARHASSNFALADFYGNASPTIIEEIDYIVSDFSQIVSPTVGDFVIDTGKAQYGYWDGLRFNTRPMIVDDIIFNADDLQYYIYNGFGVFQIDFFDRPVTFAYAQNIYRQILRREFERWAVSQNVDFITNNDYVESDPFTWNYRSAGVEGHYQGIYLRMYRSVRPHSHPWEVVGYAQRPTWWLTSYIPTSTAVDGTPRYTNTHPMWADLQAGIYNPVTGAREDRHVMSGPIPVNAQGELMDPIAAGIVNEDKLVPERRDDGWVYGDGAPIEQNFLESPYFSFATALLGYLMKPGRFIDTLWSELYVDIGLVSPNPIWRAPHVVHRDLLTRPRLIDLPIHLEVKNDQTVKQLGLNAWISEYVNSIGGNITTIFGDTIRNTQINLAWKCSGFVNQDRTIIQTLGGLRIPFEDVHTVLHRSKPTKEFFASGVLVTREGTGYRVFGFDLFNPYFVIDTPVSPIAGGQIELNEDFVATPNQHVFTVTEFRLPRPGSSVDSATLTVMINGLKLKPQHVKVTNNTIEIEEIVTINGGDIIGVSVLTVQSSPSTRVKQFTVDGVAFPYINAGRGETEEIEYGRYFDTAPDVINFMLGYGRNLIKDGWIFDDSVAPGIVRDWLYGAQSFATWVVNTTRARTQDIEDFYYSPFGRKATFESTFGQVLNVESVQNGAFGILDQEANPIDPEEVFTSRIGSKITLTPSSNAPDIYGVRVLVVEDQHVVFFSNITKFNDLIYDPILALAQPALRLDGYRSSDWNGRLEADGFIINRGALLPNFEKQAKDFTRYYERIDALDDPVKRDQARELYGWYPNAQFSYPNGTKVPMMDAIDANERSQFDYHRGMVHAKGTIRPIIAFSRGTRMGRDGVVVYEDWAWRWCDFGDTRREVVQFKVDKIDFRDKLQVVEFNVTNDRFDSIIQVEQFNRATPDVGRWIIPPVQSNRGSIVDYTLPLNLDGSYDEQTKLFVKLFDTNTNRVSVRMFHFNPYAGSRLYDPEAVCLIDYTGFLDPARYTDGSGSLYSDQLQWGPEQVGKLWWDQSRLTYIDANRLIPDYNKVAQFWGKLTYFDASITRLNQNATVITRDPLTGLVAPHNLVTGDKVVISGAIPDDYNGEWSVVVFNPTEFTVAVPGLFDTPATGNIRVQTGFVDVLEWVESPVTPSGWETYVASNNNIPGFPNGVPKDGATTSYVTRATIDGRNNKRLLYYFWVINNSGDNIKKGSSTTEVSLRLENPTINNSPWFATIDKNHLLVFVNGEQVNDGYAIEIVQDRRELDHHTEWLLMSEGSRFITVPRIVRDKLLDCLAGEDEFGSPIPSPMLSATEKFGTDTFPPQTVFSDRTSALRVFSETATAILTRKNLTSTTNVRNILPISSEGVWWNRAEYRELAYEGKAVFDTVANQVIRADRFNKNRYYEGDLIKVLQSGNTDIWTGAPVDSTYVLQDGLFLEVGVNKATASIIIDDQSTPEDIRRAFASVYSLLEKVEQNELTFALLYEMLYQHPDADWFIKTSYITLQMFDSIGQSPFVRPNEQEAVIANTIDMKPYRTKLRTSTFTYTVDQIENMGLQIDEFPDIKITILLDRLACDGREDGGWDGAPWDTELEGWDKPFWTWADLGRAETYSLGVQTGTVGVSRYVFSSPFDPTLYGHTLVLRNNGIVVVPAEVGISFTLTVTHTSVTIDFNVTLGPSYEVELLQAGGFYEGSVPTLGPEFADTLFRPYPSTYQHHVLRMMEAGIYAPFPGMEACYIPGPDPEPIDPGDDDVGPTPVPSPIEESTQSPQERIPTDIEDSVVICVKNDYTPAYEGWDTTPWDVSPWDLGPGDIGRRVFFITAGAETIIPPGTRTIPTSTTITVTDTRFVRSPTVNRIGQVLLNGNPITAGVDYQLVPVAPWVLEFPTRPDIVYAADGISTSFDATAATFGVSQVFRNNISQVLGVQYNMVGPNVEFVQPPPGLMPILSTPIGRYKSADSVETAFPTGHPGNSLAEQNVFAFVNGDLLPVSAYSVNLAGTMVTTTAPAFTDDVITFTLGNNVGDSDPLFTLLDFIGDGLTTSYIVGLNANNFTTWVFVNGRYQVLGLDYTIPAHGTIQFLAAPILGSVIHMRIIPLGAYLNYDMQHTVLIASGGPSDPLSGLTTADPSNMMVFLGDTLQNGYSGFITDYSITDGNPDVINWTTPPAAGTRITLRIVRNIQIDEIPLITILPSIGDDIRIVPRHTLVPGDIVSILYDQFPVGPLNGFRVTATPSPHDIADGIMTIAPPVLGGTITLNYNRPIRAPNPTSILVRMTNIVDRARTDHLELEPPSGFETGREVGLRVLNTTDSVIYVWNGTTWTATGPALMLGMQVLALLDQQIIERVGPNWNVIFETGDIYTTPPVLNYPLFGRGILSATYALGQAPSAAVDFPVPHQVILHPGDYWS